MLPSRSFLSIRIDRQAISRSGEDLRRPAAQGRSEEHTSELQSLMRISYAGFCLEKKKSNNNIIINMKENTKMRRMLQHTNTHKKSDHTIYKRKCNSA